MAYFRYFSAGNNILSLFLWVGVWYSFFNYKYLLVYQKVKKHNEVPSANYLWQIVNETMLTVNANWSFPFVWQRRKTGNQMHNQISIKWRSDYVFKRHHPSGNNLHHQITSKYWPHYLAMLLTELISFILIKLKQRSIVIDAINTVTTFKHSTNQLSTTWRLTVCFCDFSHVWLFPNRDTSEFEDRGKWIRWSNIIQVNSKIKGSVTNSK